MNRAELIASVQKSLDLTSKSEAERVLAAVLTNMALGLKKTKSLQLIGFGTFRVVSRKARTGRNPKTGEKIKIKASKSVRFATGKALKATL